MGSSNAHDTSWKRVVRDLCNFWNIYRLARHVANNDFAMVRERPFMDPTRNKTAQWSRVCSVKRPSAGSHAVRSDRSCCILYQSLLSSPLCRRRSETEQRREEERKRKVIREIKRGGEKEDKRSGDKRRGEERREKERSRAL